jgi:FkbM family methyltransferase
MCTAHWHSSIRNRLESSSIRRMYWAIAKRKNFVSSQQEVMFYRKLLAGLERDDLIFDVGANRGAKTDIFLRLGARVVAVEPDEACQVILRDRFLRYRVRSSSVTLVDRAVSDKIGIEELFIDGPGSAVNTISRKWANHLKETKESFKYQHCGLEFSNSKSVATTTLNDLVSLYGTPFFVKIDVEGHELNVLLGMRHPVPFLSFEVNLGTFRSDGIKCVQVLNQFSADGRFNYTPDCCSGLVLEKWLRADDLCAVLETCTDETIEVFWKSNCSFIRSRVVA